MTTDSPGDATLRQLRELGRQLGLPSTAYTYPYFSDPIATTRRTKETPMTRDHGLRAELPHEEQYEHLTLPAMDQACSYFSTDILIARWGSVDRQLRLQQELKGQIEMELTRRMQQDGATEIPDPHYVVKLEQPTPTYRQDVLDGLRELVPPAEVKRGYEAEHWAIVPGRWDMTIVKSWRRYGTDVQEIIDRAREPSRPGKLRIRPRTEPGR